MASLNFVTRVFRPLSWNLAQTKFAGHAYQTARSMSTGLDCSVVCFYD